MKKVLDIRKVIERLPESAPHTLMEVALEFMLTGKSCVLDYQGKTDEEIGIMCNNGYSESDDDSLDYAFVDENDFVPMTDEEAEALVFKVMEDDLARVKQEKLDNFIRKELGML